MSAAPQVPRLLLLSGGAPQRTTAGAVLAAELCRHYPSGRLCHLAVTAPPEHPPAAGPSENCSPAPPGPARAASQACCAAVSGPALREDAQPHTSQRALSRWLGFPLYHLSDPCWSAGRRTWRRRAAGPWRQWRLARRLDACLAAAERLARQQRSGLVWAILNRAGTILLGRRLAAALGLELVVSVWDPPECLVDQERLEPATRRRVLSEFGRTLRAAARCAVISENMRDEYRRRYGIDAIVHRYGVPGGLRRPPARGPRSPGRLTIGLAGNLYARAAWDALLAALARCQWVIAGREVSVRVVGPALRAEVSGPARVEFLGWRSPQQTLEALAAADLAYLPYWFDRRRRLSVRLCFPNKLSTYLAAGIPVLYHGPRDSSVVAFFARYPAGACCHSLEPGQIIAALRRLATDRDRYVAAVAAGQRALREELNLAVFLGRFAALLGIEPALLLPPGSLNDPARFGHRAGPPPARRTGGGTRRLC